MVEQSLDKARSTPSGVQEAYLGVLGDLRAVTQKHLGERVDQETIAVIRAEIAQTVRNYSENHAWREPGWRMHVSVSEPTYEGQVTVTLREPPAMVLPTYQALFRCLADWRLIIMPRGARLHVDMEGRRAYLPEPHEDVAPAPWALGHVLRLADAVTARDEEARKTYYDDITAAVMS